MDFNLIRKTAESLGGVILDIDKDSADWRIRERKQEGRRPDPPLVAVISLEEESLVPLFLAKFTDSELFFEELGDGSIYIAAADSEVLKKLLKKLSNSKLKYEQLR